MLRCVCQERIDDDVLETQLFLRQVIADSFRRYTLVAENAVAVRKHHVRFIRSTQSLSRTILAQASDLFIYYENRTRIQSKYNS